MDDGWGEDSDGVRVRGLGVWAWGEGEEWLGVWVGMVDGVRGATCRCGVLG